MPFVIGGDVDGTTACELSFFSNIVGEKTNSERHMFFMQSYILMPQGEGNKVQRVLWRKNWGRFGIKTLRKKV